MLDVRSGIHTHGTGMQRIITTAVISCNNVRMCSYEINTVAQHIRPCLCYIHSITVDASSRRGPGSRPIKGDWVTLKEVGENESYCPHADYSVQGPYEDNNSSLGEDP